MEVCRVRGVDRAGPCKVSRTDGMADKYSCFADDNALSASNREAAVLMVTAESHLNDQGDHEGALNMAQQAFDLYCKQDDWTAQADAMRIIVHAHRAHADQVTYEGGSGAENKAADIFDASEKKVKEQLLRFKEKGNLRGEGCMTLALGEIADSRCKHYEPDELRDILRFAEQARGLFIQAGDKKMEGMALLLIIPTQHRLFSKDEAFSNTEAAVECFRAAGDRLHEGHATEMLAYSYIMRNDLDEGTRLAMEALAIFRERNARFLEAFAMQAMAEYYLHFRKGRDALAAAEDSLDLFRELPYCKGWEAYSVDAIVQAHIFKGEDRKALTAAQEAVEIFQEKSDRRQLSMAWQSVMSVHMSQGDFSDALKAAEESLSIAQDLGDPRWEAAALLDIAQVHLSMNTLNAAADSANEATEIFQSLKDRRGEAFGMNKLNEVQLARFDDAAVVQTSMEQRAIFQELEDKSRAASCQLTIAGLASTEHRWDEAFALAEEAQEWHQEVGDKEGEGRALNFIAQFHVEKGEYEQAIEKALEMREVLRENGYLPLEANACRVMSEIHMRFGHPAEAVRSAREGLQLVKKAMDKREIVEFLLLVSNSTLELIAKEVTEGDGLGGKGMEKALRPAKEAYTIAKSLSKGRNSIMGNALYTIATVHLMSARTNEAMTSAKEALEIFQAFDDKGSEAAATVLIAEIHYMSGAQDKALDAAKAAVELSEGQMDESMKKRAQDLIEKIQGKPRLSYEHVGGGVPMAMDMGPAAAPGQAAAGGGAASAVEAKSKGLDAAEVERVVQEMAKAAIGLEDDVFLDSPLMDSGMDSLTAVSFRNGLQQQLGVKLPSSLMFDYPTMKEVAGRIVELSLEDE